MCDIIYSGYDVINIVGSMTYKQWYDVIKRHVMSYIVPMVSYMEWERFHTYIVCDIINLVGGITQIL